MEIILRGTPEELKELIKKEPCCEQGSIVVKNKIGIDYKKLENELKKKNLERW